ncbi:MFS transporter [Streptomyces aureus]|uniref:MFS transporter n=1 Tax=Streptomyces aureus TaxID=193461 RepID=UPI00056C523C|nr:MFS transporter [Streptomyces aureus]
MTAGKGEGVRLAGTAATRAKDTRGTRSGRFLAGRGPAYVVILGRFVTNIGFFMVVPFLAVHLTRDEGLSSFRTGVLFAVMEFTRRGLGIPSGWVSDRFGAARILTLGLAVEAGAYVVFTVAGGSFAVWGAAVALLGVGGSLNNNGARSVLASSRSGGVAADLSRYYVSINGAALIGPLIGTALMAAGAMKAGFLVAAALHLGFAAVSAVLLRGLHAVNAAPIRPAAMAEALRDRPLMVFCALAVGGWFLVTQYRVALPLTVVHQKLSSDLVGVLTAGNAVVVMVTVWLIGARVEKRSTLGRLDLFTVSGVLLGGGWLLCSVDGISPVVAAVVVTSIGESLFCGVVDAVVAGLATEGRTGLYLGYSTMAWGVGGMLGGFVGGGFDLAADRGALPLFWLVLALVGLGYGAGTRGVRRSLADAVDRRRAAGTVPDATTSPSA